MDENRLITIAQAVRITGLSRNTIVRRIQSEKIPTRPLKAGYKKHGPVGLPLSEVLSLLPPGEREAARTRLG